MSIIVCRPKSLPIEKFAIAERRALEINPDNAAERRTVARSPVGRRGGPRRIAVVIARKWPKKGVRLSVSFMDNPPSALRSRILQHMNAWGEQANVLFSETQGVGQVRIARLDSPEDMAGYWSYIGTEILDADEDEPTLNLEGFTTRVSDAEFRRVVRHEAGHTLGFDHEHSRSDIVNRIDRKKAFAYFDRTEGWSPEEVEEQVLTPLAKKSIMGTRESDPLSIMCYQLPAAIMKDRKAVPGGTDINANDFAFAKSLYPKPSRATDVSMPEAPASVASTARDVDVSGTFELVVMESTAAFAQIFASYGGARVTSNLQLRADKGAKSGGRTKWGEIIRVHERIKAYTNREKGSLPNDDEMILFGSQMFDTLFQGDVKRLYDEARARHRGRLDLVLTSMIPWIAEKPWEFAYDHGRASFLATEEIHFVRNVMTNVPADLVVRSGGSLRILVVSAQPVGFGRLSIDQEVAVIRRGFEPLVEAGLVEIEALARATPAQIHGYLQTGSYQIVHFIGHGVYDEARGEGCLIFVNEQGGEYPLGERSVREIFRGRGLSLVFLNSCESGRGGRADFNKGVAQSLVSHGLPSLVANQYSVLDSSATSFAQHFYWSLAHGTTLAEAAREARIAVNYSLHGEPIDWAVPVLYARNPNETLCTRPSSPQRVPATSVRSTTRRATAGHPSRIAVWDMDNVFPSLDQTLQGMTRSQEIFGFEMVDLSVPLGVWDLDSVRGTPYLWAEHLAHRLQRTPMELGVEALACVTRHWMRSDEWFNIYNWWPGKNKSPIMIFSVAGFEDMAPAGPETNRAIANAMVCGLAGFYGDVGSHTRGAKDCPMAFNEGRVFKYVVGRLKFDASCRKLLRPKLGPKFDALETLLKTFE